MAGVRRLARDPEWLVKHSFPFGVVSTSYAWTTGDIDIDRSSGNAIPSPSRRTSAERR
jgi:hypothetical protein